jgi:hypothetical protein
MFHSYQINMDHGNRNGNFTSWPGLTEDAVEKHLSKSTSTTKVHLNQQRQNARTKKNQKHKGHYHRTWLGSWNQNPIRICCNNRCRTNIHWSNRQISSGFKQRQEVHHDIIWLWQQCHLSTAYQIQNSSWLIKSFPSYGTGIGGERPETKTYETGQWGIKITKNVPSSTRYHIPIGPSV